MVAKPVTGHSVFSRALLAPGDVGIGTHSARGRHSTCAMAPKPMEYEITDGRRGDETLAQQPPRESSRVRRPPYRNSGYKPSDDALKDKGAHLAATEQPVDTSTAAGKAFFDMLGVFAEFETNLRRERQGEGIAAAKQRGAYRGRPPRIDLQAIQHRLARGLSPTQIAREMGVSRGTVYKARAAMTHGA